jgi:diguanylate cyclase (GGDEF)-like protein/PAS domain S-box-containing protein
VLHPWFRTQRRPSRAAGTALAAAALAGLIALAAGVGDTRTVLAVGGLLVAGVNGLVGLRLMFLAAVRHFGHDQGGPCTSAGLLGVGLLATGSAGWGIAVHTVRGGAIHGGAYYGVVALVFGAGAYLPAMLMLPGAAHTTIGRLRRGLDGLTVGTCLLFAAWVLVIAPHGTINSLGFWVALMTCSVAAVTVVAGLRAARSRPLALACAGGSVLSVAALAGLTLTLGGDGDARWLLAALVALLCAAPLVVWFGVRATEASPEPVNDGTTETFAGYPVLTIPLATALTVALDHALTGNGFDRPSIVLGAVGMAGVAVREALGAVDVSRYARKMFLREAQFRSLVAGSTDVIMVLDQDLIVRWQSPAAARHLGLSDQEVVGRHFKSMIHPEDAVRVADRLDRIRTATVEGPDVPGLIEARIRDGFGAWRETESSVSDQREVAAVAGLVIHVRDIGERKDLERKLHRLAYADQLTGLANRRQTLQSIGALRSVARVRGALVLIELEGFQAVNDVRGYDIGDAVLVEVARRLRAGAADTDLVSRLSGDEFAVVTEASQVQAYALATRLLTMLAEPIVLPGTTVHLSACIGLTDLAGADAPDEVLRRADLALRRARQLGRGRVEWYDEVLEQAILRRMTLEQELPDALVRGELDLIYQPILQLAPIRPLAVEALLRWRHPRLGTLLPADVIPVAEDLGLIEEIGSWVVQQATRQLASWLREGRDLSVAVNVSPRQLVGAALFADVAAALDRHELDPNRLVLEVAEAGLAADPGRVDEQLVALRALGVRTALDEFGTGPDSLAHLRRLPMDMVKIGRSFFDETAAEPGRTAPIIDVMVGLGRRLGIEVVAQGLEAPAHLDVVRAAGCRLGQGHLFARAQPAERTEAYLDGFPARPG